MPFGSGMGYGGWGLGSENQDNSQESSSEEPQLTREEYLRQRREAEYRKNNYLRCLDCDSEWDLNRGSRCPKCGQKYGDKKKRKVDIIVCPTCGERERDEEFCTSCGTRTQSDTKLVD